MSRQPKNHHEALIGLSLVHNLGLQRIRLLLQEVEHPAEIFTLSQAELQATEGIGPVLAQTILDFEEWPKVDKMLAQTRRTEAKLLSFYDDSYPDLLRQIYDPPLLLWVKGDMSILSEPGLAVVGTRRATSYGIKMAETLSRELVGRGLSIISGLAYGVDAAAHRATLKAGGTTVAVLGSGIDWIYPEKHGELAANIIDKGGAVITEFRPGTPPDAGNFPVRNRIVSGLSLGTLVVESGLKGGSMITAQSALTQNREVFVIPHALENVNGVGCNHLIKRGAGKLVQTVEDVLEELPAYLNVGASEDEPVAEKESTWKNLDLDQESEAICELLENGPMHIDDLSEALEKPSHLLLAKLLELEMQDGVRQTAGKNFELR